MIVVAAPQVALNYSIPHKENPPVRSDKFLLLTIGGVICTGPWQGALGERYLAWALLPKTDKPVMRFIRANPELTAAAVKIESICEHIQVTSSDGTITIYDDRYL